MVDIDRKLEARGSNGKGVPLPFLLLLILLFFIHI